MLSDFRLGIKFANIIAIGTLYLHDLFPLAPFDYHPHRNKTKCAYRGLGPNAACPARNRSRAILLSDDSIRSLQGRYDFSEPCIAIMRLLILSTAFRSTPYADATSVGDMPSTESLRNICFER